MVSFVKIVVMLPAAAYRLDNGKNYCDCALRGFSPEKFSRSWKWGSRRWVIRFPGCLPGISMPTWTILGFSMSTVNMPFAALRTTGEENGPRRLSGPLQGFLSGGCSPVALGLDSPATRLYPRICQFCKMHIRCPSGGTGRRA